MSFRLLVASSSAVRLDSSTISYNRSRISRYLSARTYAAAAPARGKLPIQQLRDEAIRTNDIKLVRSNEEGGGLGPLTTKAGILRGLDRRKYWLVQGAQV